MRIASISCCRGRKKLIGTEGSIFRVFQRLATKISILSDCSNQIVKLVKLQLWSHKAANNDPKLAVIEVLCIVVQDPRLYSLRLHIREGGVPANTHCCLVNTLVCTSANFSPCIVDAWRAGLGELENLFLLRGKCVHLALLLPEHLHVSRWEPQHLAAAAKSMDNFSTQSGHGVERRLVPLHNHTGSCLRWRAWRLRRCIGTSGNVRHRPVRMHDCSGKQ
mmetsp:Transcript_82018/g.145303  ORF Transcript_82018/g.145303 Transcript_82018/m.145303 type:complete len:220 (+) Transcript_82018:54-713(+)